MICRLLIISCFVTGIAAAIVKQPHKENVRPQNNAIGKPQTSFYPYEDARNSVIEAEDLLSTGGRLQLNSRESKANAIFLKYKHDELVKGFQDPETNAASMHFFKAKPLIERSKIFQFLKKMPKGAVLHAHTSATVSSKWVVENIFYMTGLLRCTTKDNLSILSFRQLPEKHRCVTSYVRVSDERKASASVRDYDGALEAFINLYTPSPELEYSSINKVWSKFQNMFTTIGDALLYIPAFRAYHWQMLEELYNDNVMYAEVRLSFNEEDNGQPLHNFADILYNKPKTSKFFFHAGETNWYGASTDLNLLDALLLNTTRIGHGYALVKHPVLYNAVKTRDIAVEVSPISNQVLELVWDLRNHPGSFFISQNIPIVICNDDPGFWNAKALSYDFYYAIMSMAPNNAGLKMLKQLVWNSIKYSTLQPSEHQRAFALLQAQWDHFIENVANGLVV